MPFVWQTKFHKVSIKSIKNIISLSNLGFGSDFFWSSKSGPKLSQTKTVPNGNCPRPKLIQTKTVLGRNCPKPQLSKTNTDPDWNCLRLKLFHTKAVSDQNCPTPKLSHTETVPHRNCPRPKLSRIHLSLTQTRSKSDPNNFKEKSKTVPSLFQKS